MPHEWAALSVASVCSRSYISGLSRGYELETRVGLSGSRLRGDLLSGALTSLRRLVASMMLAAMASFVLHGAAMAGAHRHAAAPQGCEAVGHVHAEAKASAHVHADGTAHVHLTHDDPGPADHEPSGQHHADGGDNTCCGSLCTVAITAGAPATPSVLLRVTEGLPFLDQDGSGAALTGLKRPPRTTDIT